MAFGGVRLILALVPPNSPRMHEVEINLPVLLFAAGLSGCGGHYFRNSAGAALFAHPATGCAASQSITYRQHARRPAHAQPSGCIPGRMHGDATDRHLAYAAQFLASASAGSRLRFEPCHARAGRSVRAAVRRLLPNAKTVKLAFADRALASFAATARRGVRSDHQRSAFDRRNLGGRFDASRSSRFHRRNDRKSTCAGSTRAISPPCRFRSSPGAIYQRCRSHQSLCGADLRANRSRSLSRRESHWPANFRHRSR